LVGCCTSAPAGSSDMALPRLFLLACWAVSASAHCRGLDRMALIKLYESMGGASWTNNRNWNTTSGTSAENKENDPCDPKKRWYGVGFYDPCEKYLDDIVGTGPETNYLTRVRGSMQGCFAGRITSLNLRRNNLSGNLTVPELGDLANLTLLDLSWNAIQGEIPTQIGRLRNIQLINLAHNSLSGGLPTELGQLNDLGPPSPGGCGIDDPCPLGVQLKMNDFNVGHNEITGTIPTELGALTHLRILDLTNNNLTGSVPLELGELTALQVLYLRENSLGGSLPDGLFENMTELRYVLLQENSLEGAVPPEVGRLKKVNNVYMYANRLSSVLPEEIGEMTNAREIKLQDNYISGTIPGSIGKLFNLRHLDLYNNRMTGDVPPGIANLTNLKELYIQNIHLTPVRQRYCRMRIPNVGKYNWRIMREEFRHYTSVMCNDMHDTEFTFNNLQTSGSFDAAA